MARAVLVGRAGSPGVGVGRLLVVPATVERGSNGGEGGSGATAPDREEQRLLAALTRAAQELEALAVQTGRAAGDEVGEIFEAQALFARDPGLVEPALTAIRAGSDAAAAVDAAATAQADRLASVDDPFFRERAADLRDVARRVVGILDGRRPADLWHPDGSPAVIVAVDLEPSSVATLRRELVTGIALAGGAATGHAAIVARALGIPLVLGLGSQVATVEAGVRAAVDGDRGLLLLDPDDGEVAASVVTARAAASAGEPTVLSADLPVGVAANVGSAREVEVAVSEGADGIGLVRTELLFLGRSAPPSVAEQAAVYRQIRRAAGGRPVVFRTLDVGGDKPAAWQSDAPEPNPALGVRGLRLGLARPILLEEQFAALAQAADGQELRIMLPMVAVPAEIVAARERLEAVLDRLATEGTVRPSSVRLGAMVEVPSAALVADGLAAVADFFSIGTNDLVQYALAADRTNPALAELASPLQPAVLRLIRAVVDAAQPLERHVAVCGEAAADPAVIPLLVGLGVDELSVAPSSVGAVRAQVARLDVAAWRGVAAEAAAAPTIEAVRGLLSRAHGRGAALTK